MRTLILKRIAKKPTYTIGHLYFNGNYICDTLEDTDRGLNNNMTMNYIVKKKVKGSTCIPYGTYQLDLNTVSPKFRLKSWAIPYLGRIPRLLSVKGFDGVLIHPGNTAADTLGCILVGQNKVVGKIINSVSTFHDLMNKYLTKDKNWEIKIE